MKSLILINSTGPMGASLVASIIEHMNYINLPVRKRGLNDYVIKKKNLKRDNFFKNRTIQILENYSKKIQLSGLGVQERDKSNKKSLFEYKKNFEKINKFKNKKFNNLSDMYFQSMHLFNQCTIYKKRLNKPKGSIEFLLGINFYDTKSLYNCYRKNFKVIKLINLNRNFNDWFEALASQKFAKKISFKFLKMSIINNYLFYKQYNTKKNNHNALNINFEDLFIDKKKTINKINYFISDKKKKSFYRSIRGKNFDLFGSVYNFKRAFTLSDKKYMYLNKIAHKYIQFTILVYNKSEFLGRFLDLIFQFLYIYNLIVYKIMNSKNMKY